MKIPNEIPYFGPCCSQCRRGEYTVPAQSYVEGRIDGRPYRANLCDDHVDVLMGEGLEIDYQRDAQRTRAHRDVASKRAERLGKYLSQLRRTAPINESNINLMNRVQQHLLAAQIDGR